MSTPSVFDINQTSLPRDRVQATNDEYLSLFDKSPDARRAQYMKMVNDYYNLVTDFYEFGWGQSFHFAPRFRGESFAASLARHEHYLALKLGLRPGMTVIDIGCGIGGPMRAIARFSGASVVGINNNAYQIERGRKQNIATNLAHLCSFQQADFMKLPFAEGSVDAAYAIEATCHAPDKTALFREILRTLKPGAQFAGYEWCLTDLYDGNNPMHRQLKLGVETGDALPELPHYSEVPRALAAAGFEVIETADLALTSDPETPWYEPLSGQLSLTGIKHTPAGRWLTGQAVRVLERVKIAPKGAYDVSKMLQDAAVALVGAGQTGIFTPAYYFRARKPG
ncbi:MAG TPA: methyltransferase domain-containing protein [Pseudomonadota bacterium]|nr:methyltransferase domain-containing protein [Pseudomonadota bacterium]